MKDTPCDLAPFSSRYREGKPGWLEVLFCCILELLYFMGDRISSRLF
jgi:hypothetical protein